MVNRTLYFATKSSVFWNYIASSSSDNTIQVWDATTGAHITTYRGHSAPVNTVMWSPDGRRIATGSFDKTVQVWDASTGEVLYTYRGYNVDVAKINNRKGVLPDLVFALAWSPDDKRIVTAFSSLVQVSQAS